MEKIVDEATGRLIVGMMETIQVIVTVLQLSKTIDLRALEYAVEQRLGTHGESDLEAVPLSLMLKFLRPAQPPHPSLRLIRGGKS